MYNHSPENYICPLCQIARGETTEKGNQELSVIWRDKSVTVFIAGKWWRSNPGHVIVIPNEHIENIYIKEISPHRHVYVDILSLFIKANISIIEYDNVKYTGGSTRDKFSIFAAFFINHLEQNKIIKKIDNYNYSLNSLKLFDKYQLPYNFWYKKTPEEIFNKLQTHTTIINNSKYNNLYKLFDNIYSKAYSYGDNKNIFTSDEKNEGLETFIDIIHRLKEYEDLGTVSELIDLKCRYDIIKHGEELKLQ